MKTVKEILTEPDIFLALLCYRPTPIPDLGASPAELAMGRKLRSTLPTLPSTLMPRSIDPEQLRMRDSSFKQRQKQKFDRHNRVRPLPQLHPRDPVLIKLDGQEAWKQPAKVIKECGPRSYNVKADNGGEL